MTWTIQPRFKIGKLAAIAAGTGPQVLLIHGVGLRAEAWGAQIDSLSQTCRVVAVDMPGHGHSAALAADAQLTDFTDAIAACLDGPCVVIGHSFGAMIALDMAIRYPKQVQGVAALNAIYRRSPEAKLAVITRADSLDGVTKTDPSAPLERWFGTAVSPEREACHDWLNTVDPAGYRAAYRVFAHEDGPSDQSLGKLTCPALFLTGREEPNSTPAMSNAMAKRVLDGRSETIEDAAHILPMTHARQVNLTLTDFVKACFK